MGKDQRNPPFFGSTKPPFAAHETGLLESHGTQSENSTFSQYERIMQRRYD